MSCRYRSRVYVYFASGSCCTYMLTTGDRRGCPPGDGCVRFAPKTDDVPKKHPIDLHRLLNQSAAKARIRETLVCARHYDRVIGRKKEE